MATALLLKRASRSPRLKQHWRNRAIAAHNRRRQAWAEAARQADPQQKRRRAAARCPGAAEAGRPAPRVVHDSGRDLQEQSIDNPTPDLGLLPVTLRACLCPAISITLLL